MNGNRLRPFSPESNYFGGQCKLRIHYQLEPQLHDNASYYGFSHSTLRVAGTVRIGSYHFLACQSSPTYEDVLREASFSSFSHCWAHVDRYFLIEMNNCNNPRRDNDDVIEEVNSRALAAQLPFLIVMNT